jgi:hypothetical protein
MVAQQLLARQKDTAVSRYDDETVEQRTGAVIGVLQYVHAWRFVYRQGHDLHLIAVPQSEGQPEKGQETA